MLVSMGGWKMLWSSISLLIIILSGLLIFLMFYIITLKHFIVIEKISFIKKLGIIVLLTAINPMVIDTVYELLFEDLYILFGRYYSRSVLDVTYIEVSLVITTVSVLLNLSFAFLYAFIVKGKNMGVSVFTYFMLSGFVVSVDNMMQPTPARYEELRPIVDIS